MMLKLFLGFVLAFVGLVALYVLAELTIGNCLDRGGYVKGGVCVGAPSCPGLLPCRAEEN